MTKHIYQVIVLFWPRCLEDSHFKFNGPQKDRVILSLSKTADFRKTTILSRGIRIFLKFCRGSCGSHAGKAVSLGITRSLCGTPKPLYPRRSSCSSCRRRMRGRSFALFIGGEPLRREGQVRLQRHLGTLHAFQLHDRRLWGC